MKNSNQIEFLQLYDPVHKQLSKFCRAIAGNREDAKDLINDTILNVLEGFDKIKDKSAFKSYIFSTASHLHKKKIRRLKFNADFNEIELSHLVDLSQNPEYITDFKIIYQEILSLPTKTAETIILFHISDLSLEEIRNIQGGSLSGVKLRLKRGREKLFSQLKTPEKVRMALLFLNL